MKLFISMFAVLLCVSVVQAATGTPIVYDFEDLTPPGPLWTQDPNTPVTWDSVNPGAGQGLVSVRNDPTYAPDPNDGQYARVSSGQGEQLVSTLSAGAGYTLFNINPNVRQFQLSWDGMINSRGGWLVGIWIDGIDTISNSTSNTEVEHLVQFGLDHVGQAWRVRGAGGVNSTTDSNYMIAGDNVVRVTLVLDIDIDANGGEGEMSLTVIDPNGSHQPPNLQNVSMCLLHTPLGDPQNPRYSNPGNWTGWYIRNQRLIGGDNPGYTVGDNTLDNLTLIPEPATLVLISLGSLAYLRRRGHRERW